MASRNWLRWLVGCGLFMGGSLMESASAQDGYINGYGAPPADPSYYAGTWYDDGSTIPGTPPSPYGMPMQQLGANPYTVAPIPESPQIFSSGDPFQSAFRSYEGFFFRAEYLQFDYTRPGDVLLGAQQAGFVDPRIPFDVFDGTGTLLGSATIPNLDAMRLVNVPGVRATVGVPLMFGSAEASIFSMNTAQEVFLDTSLPGTDQQPFLGTPTLDHGAFSDNINLYNDFFKASFTSKLWSSDANIYFDGPNSNFFSFSPMIGFKYLDLRERLSQQGSFTPDPTTGLPTVISSIDSSSTNQLYAPQIGLRSKFENTWGAVTFDPKVGLGANVFKNRVSTFHFRSNGDPFVATSDSGATLSPVVDLNLTGRLNLSQHIALTVGYNFIFVSHLTRPQDNIYYNDNGAFPTLPGVVVKTHKEDMTFQGLTVGVEIRGR